MGKTKINPHQQLPKLFRWGFLFAIFAVQSAFGLLTTEALTLCRIRVNPIRHFLVGFLFGLYLTH